MGYQESLIRVSRLAEVSGICRAIEESEELKRLEYLVCCCATQAKCDLYHGGMFGERKISDVPEGEPPIIHKGDLFAVVAGARLYQPFLFIGNIAGINDVDYSQLFEDIPLELAHRDAKLHRDAARKAEVFMRRSLNRSYNFAMRGDHPIKLPDEFLDASDQKSDHLAVLT